MCCTVQDWPNWHLFAARYAKPKYRHQLRPGVTYDTGASFTLYPLPIAWMEDLFQKEFWEIFVSQYGGEAIKPYPKLVGRRFMLTGINPQTHMSIQEDVPVWGQEFFAYQQQKGVVDEVMGGTNDDIQPSHMDIDRVRQAYKQAAWLEEKVAGYWQRTGDS
jgi:hypothetical protein